MTIHFDGFSADSSAQIASKQHQAGAERSQRDAEQHARWLSLLRVDPRACEMMEAYATMDEAGRLELWRHVRALRVAHPRGSDT